MNLQSRRDNNPKWNFWVKNKLKSVGCKFETNKVSYSRDIIEIGRNNWNIKSNKGEEFGVTQCDF